MRSARRRRILHLLLRGRDDVARIVDADDSGVLAPALILVVHDRGDPDHAAAGREDRSARAAGREPEVGHDGMRLDAADGSRRHVLLLTERSADREELLPVHDGRLRRLRASQRHRPHRCGDLRIDPEDGDIPHRIGREDARRHLDVRRELHLHRRRGADDPLVRRDESLRVDQESRRVGARSPQGDDAVLPLRQEERGVGLQRRRGGRVAEVAGSTSALSAVSSRTASRPATMSTDLRPLVGLAVERDRPVRFHRVVPRAQPHVGGAVQRRDDPPGRRACRIVADEQRMARHRRCLPLGVDQDDLYVEDAERLAGGRARADENERREEQRAEHEVIV